MKIEHLDKENATRYPYLAKHRETGEVVLIGRHATIILSVTDTNCQGDGWSIDGNMEHLFEPLPIGTSYKLTNE